MNYSYPNQHEKDGASHAKKQRVRALWTTMQIALQIATPIGFSFSPLIVFASNTSSQSVQRQMVESYTLKTHETTKMVARRYHLTLAQLAQLNVDHGRHFKQPFAQLGTGTSLYVPARPSQKQPEHSALEVGVANAASRLASIAQSDERSDAARNMAEDEVKEQFLSEVNSHVSAWLNRYGNAKVSLNTDSKGNMDGSSVDMLLPLHENQQWLTFTQFGLRDINQRWTANLGFGQRYFGPSWMVGGNLFYDADLTGHHYRMGIGTEYAEDFFKLALNSYIRLSDWKQSHDLDDYLARPSNGFDIAAQAWLPQYPQVGGELKFEQYYGDLVGLFGDSEDDLQRNPHAVTFNLNYTPIPLITAGIGYKYGDDNKEDLLFNLDLNLSLGQPWSEQIDPSHVSELHTLMGQRHDLVQRNNNIVLEYKKKQLLSLTLTPNSLPPYLEGKLVSFNVNIKHKYAISSVHFSGSLKKAANIADWNSYSDNQPLMITLPAWDPNGNNHYTLTAQAADSENNLSNLGQLVVDVSIDSANMTFSAAPNTIATGGDVSNKAQSKTAKATPQDPQLSTLTFSIKDPISKKGRCGLADNLTLIPADQYAFEHINGHLSGPLTEQSDASKGCTYTALFAADKATLLGSKLIAFNAKYSGTNVLSNGIRIIGDSHSAKIADFHFDGYKSSDTPITTDQGQTNPSVGLTPTLLVTDAQNNRLSNQLVTLSIIKNVTGDQAYFLNNGIKQEELTVKTRGDGSPDLSKVKLVSDNMGDVTIKAALKTSNTTSYSQNDSAEKTLNAKFITYITGIEYKDKFVNGTNLPHVDSDCHTLLVKLKDKSLAKNQILSFAAKDIKGKGFSFDSIERNDHCLPSSITKPTPMDGVVTVYFTSHTLSKFTVMADTLYENQPDLNNLKQIDAEFTNVSDGVVDLVDVGLDKPFTDADGQHPIVIRAKAQETTGRGVAGRKVTFTITKGNAHFTNGKTSITKTTDADGVVNSEGLVSQSVEASEVTVTLVPEKKGEEVKNYKVTPKFEPYLDTLVVTDKDAQIPGDGKTPHHVELTVKPQYQDTDGHPVIATLTANQPDEVIIPSSTAFTSTSQLVEIKAKSAGSFDLTGRLSSGQQKTATVNFINTASGLKIKDLTPVIKDLYKNRNTPMLVSLTTDMSAKMGNNSLKNIPVQFSIPSALFSSDYAYFKDKSGNKFFACGTTGDIVTDENGQAVSCGLYVNKAGIGRDIPVTATINKGSSKENKLTKNVKFQYDVVEVEPQTEGPVATASIEDADSGSNPAHYYSKVMLGAFVADMPIDITFTDKNSCKDTTLPPDSGVFFSSKIDKNHVGKATLKTNSDGEAYFNVYSQKPIKNVHLCAHLQGSPNVPQRSSESLNFVDSGSYGLSLNKDSENTLATGEQAKPITGTVYDSQHVAMPHAKVTLMVEQGDAHFPGGKNELDILTDETGNFSTQLTDKTAEVTYVQGSTVRKDGSVDIKKEKYVFLPYLTSMEPQKQTTSTGRTIPPEELLADGSSRKPVILTLSDANNSQQFGINNTQADRALLNTTIKLAAYEQEKGNKPKKGVVFYMDKAGTEAISSISTNIYDKPQTTWTVYVTSLQDSDNPYNGVGPLHLEATQEKTGKTVDSKLTAFSPYAIVAAKINPDRQHIIKTFDSDTTKMDVVTDMKVQLVDSAQAPMPHKINVCYDISSGGSSAPTSIIQARTGVLAKESYCSGENRLYDVKPDGSLVFSDPTESSLGGTGFESTKKAVYTIVIYSSQQYQHLKPYLSTDMTFTLPYNLAIAPDQENHPADGLSSIPIKATVTDNGKPISGVNVRFSVTGKNPGNHRMITSSGISGADGVVPNITLTDNIAETVNITATIDNSSLMHKGINVNLR